MKRLQRWAGQFLGSIGLEKDFMPGGLFQGGHVDPGLCRGLHAMGRHIQPGKPALHLSSCCCLGIAERHECCQPLRQVVSMVSAGLASRWMTTLRRCVPSASYHRARPHRDQNGVQLCLPRKPVSLSARLSVVTQKHLWYRTQKLTHGEKAYIFHT